MKIFRIGTFTKQGMFFGWSVGDEDITVAMDSRRPGEFGLTPGGYCLKLDLDTGAVLVNGVEVVEWTEARRRAMAE